MIHVGTAVATLAFLPSDPIVTADLRGV